ncbi:MAG: TonB-dependent receptor [Chlorobi bacterium]|nr:TonB-dependent receptor [Chlorobiota bacterium]
MKKYIIIPILFLSLTIFAQRHYPGGMNRENMPKDAVVTGNVKSEQTKKPVQFANAALFSMRDSSVVAGVVADENGKFVMTGLPYGKYYMVIDFIGFYKKVIYDIKLFPHNKNLNIGTIYLKEAAENLDEVVVNGERSLVEYKIDRKVINIGKNINASGGTLVDALENVPSVQVDIDGNVTMRGSSNFQVLIDGKPSVLDANDILQQIPASSVENIEIITNPSVKFDPDGTTGIINIVMKKNHKSGLTGVINSSIGTRNKYSTDFLLNYKTKKIGFYIGANYGNRSSTGTGNSVRTTLLNDTTNYLESESERTHQRKYYSVKGGIDFYLNDKNTLSLSGKYGYFGFAMGSKSDIYEYTLPVTSDYYTINDGTFEIGGGFYSGTLDYSHNFAKKGHTLNFSADYSVRSGGIENTVIETESDPTFTNNLNESKYRTFQDRSRDRLRIKLDYVYPINEKSKIEAGYQSRILSSGGDYVYENFIEGIYTEDKSVSNDMIFTRNIHSLYTSYSGEFAGITFMAGIRGEYTDRLIHQLTSGEKYPINRLDFFPSLHFSKQLSKTDQMQLSYSRRVNRPRHWYLNPFPGYSDAYSVRQGNPALLPEFIDSYELAYNKRIKKSFFNIDIYYRQTNNSINRIQSLMPDGKILYTFDNLDKEYAYGSELSGNLQFFKWWNLYANINLYNFNLEGETAGETTKNNSYNYDGRINSTFMFTKNSRLQINGFYNAPTVTTQGNRKGFYIISAAYRQEFLKKKLSVVLRVNDIFKTGKYITDTEGLGFTSHNEMLREAPVFMLSLSYKINNYKQKRGDRENMNDMDEGGMM